MLFLCSPSPILYMMCILILYILIAVVVGCISHTISVLVVVNDVRVYTYGNAYNNGEGIDRRTARQTSTPNVGIVNSGNFKIDLGFFSCSPQWVCRVYSYTRRDERQLSQYAKLVHHFSHRSAVCNFATSKKYQNVSRRYSWFSSFCYTECF